MCVHVSACLQERNGKACGRGLVSSLSSSSCIYPRTRKHTGFSSNPLRFTDELIHCDVTESRFSQTLGAWWPLRLSPLPPHTPSEATNGPQTLVYRDLISRHPGRYVSDHKQAVGERKMVITMMLFASITWHQQVVTLIIFSLLRIVQGCFKERQRDISSGILSYL